MSVASNSLVRLIYVSRMSRACGPKDLEDILAVSRRNNVDRGITGALCYSGRGFLQCLEGPRDAVNVLYGLILTDTRNSRVTLLSYGPIEERAFGQWSMAYVRSDQVDRLILANYGLSPQFDPYQLNAQQALGLLRDTARERALFLARQRDDQAPI